MRTFQKSEIANSLLLEYMSEINAINEKINHFRKKYSLTFVGFEIKLKSEDENFNAWDDYMEWKSYENVYKELSEKIVDIKGGNFKVA